VSGIGRRAFVARYLPLIPDYRSLKPVLFRDQASGVRDQLNNISHQSVTADP
jgi:hypothetical protein